jgi:hypothetical protein
MSPASRRQYPGTAHSNRNSHVKVVKVVAHDPRSRSSSSFSNDSADDEDNGVRDCRRYMSPASRRQYPGTARSDNLMDVQAILAIVLIAKFDFRVLQLMKLNQNQYQLGP